jgi:hypothetical protein
MALFQASILQKTKQEGQALFENHKTLTSQLKTEIAKTDKEIDQMVYKLYDLTDEEMKIVQP